MQQDLLMPKLGLTMTEGVMVEWLKNPGDAFLAGEGLYVVETEKVANEVPASADGALLSITAKIGDTVACGATIGTWDDGAPQVTPAAPKADSGNGVIEKPNPDAAQTNQSSLDVRQAPPVASRKRASPLARRLARELDISLDSLTGTGPRGRVVARDVANPSELSIQPPKTEAASMHRGVHVKPSNAQLTMARRLTVGKQETPHFYLAREAEVGRLLLLRQELKEARPDRKLTINHFIVAAVGRALAQMPEVNQVWTPEGILRLNDSDVGIAVDTARGLVAPVLRGAGSKDLASLSTECNRLVDRARTQALTAADMEGGSITVSNAGMHNVTYMTSIINPGQAMILGVGSVREVFRPDEAGKPALRREMGLVLSADHRILDGATALKFLGLVVAQIERPAALLLT